MSGNAQPQFTAAGNIGSAKVTAQNTNSDGTGNIGTPTIYVAFTAGANGSYVENCRIIGVATSAGSSLNASCLRVYVSSQASGATSSANTFLVGEVSIGALVVDSATAATNVFDVPLGFRLPAGWTILVSTGTAAAANTAWQCTVYGGDY